MTQTDGMMNKTCQTRKRERKWISGKTGIEREKKGVKIQIRADENRERDEGKNNENEYKK